MRLVKRVSCLVLSLSMLSLPVISHADEDYYNAINEYNQIWNYINNGLYLEAIRDSQRTMDWHYLSPDDIQIFTGFMNEAKYKYEMYTSGETTYDNISQELKQIRSFISRGLYIEAMNMCEQTQNWHHLSHTDWAQVQSYYNDAFDKYQNYLNKYYMPDYIYKAKAALKIPASAEVSYEASRPDFSPSAGQYVISVAFYQDGIFVASADVDPETGKPVDKEIPYMAP